MNAFRLARVDADGVQGGELVQMRRARRDHEERTPRAQDAGKLGAVARCEHAQRQIDGAVGEWDLLPYVAAHRSDPLVRPCRVTRCLGRSVERDAAAVRQDGEDARQMVSGPRADVQDDRQVRITCGVGMFRKRSRQWLEVTRPLDLGARRHHTGVVTRRRAPARRSESDIAVSGNVVTVVTGTGQTPCRRREGLEADGATEPVGDGRQRRRNIRWQVDTRAPAYPKP